MSKRNMIVLMVLILLSSIPAITSAGSWNGWIYQDPYPTSVNLFDVKFITPMKGWITGKYGLILYTEDGGETWEAQESGTEEDLMRVSFVNEKMGWATGRSGRIIHTEDGGKKWVTQYNIKALPTRIFFINEKEGWVTGSNPLGAVYKTQDSGKTWVKLDTGISRAISSVYFINSQIGWILAGEDVYRTTDGGKKWEKSTLPISEPSSPPSLRRFPGGVSMEEGLGSEWWFGGIAFANEKQGWAAVFHWIFHTDDGGKTWAVQRETGNLSVGHISFRDAKNGCVSGGTIYCTEDGGKTWQERLGVEPGGSKMLGGLSLTGQSAGWAVGNGGRIMKTVDKGKSWEIASTWNKCGSGLIVLNEKTRWLRGAWLPDICRTDNGGETWTKQEVGIKIRSLLFIDESAGWALGSQIEGKDPDNPEKVYQVIKRTTDGGKTWVTQFKELTDKKSFYDISLSSLYFANRDTGWVVGDKGTILHTKNGGERWERQQSGITLNLFRVYFTDTKTGVAIGDRGVALGEDREEDKKAKGVILYTADGGKHWQTVWERIPVLMSGLFFADKNRAWVTVETLSGVLLLYSSDGGKTWNEKEKLKDYPGYSSTPYFLNKEKGVLFLRGFLLDGINEMFLVTDNGGKTWTKMREPLKKHPWHISEIFEKAVNDSK